MSQVNFVLFEYTTKFWTHNFVISCLCNISIGTDSAAVKRSHDSSGLKQQGTVLFHTAQSTAVDCRVIWFMAQATMPETRLFYLSAPL